MQLKLTPDYIEGKLQLITHPHQTMHRRSCFYFEVRAIGAEFSLRPKFAAADCSSSDHGTHPALKRRSAKIKGSYSWHIHHYREILMNEFW